MSSGNFFIRFFSAIWRGINGLRKVLHLVLLLFIFMLVFGVMSGEAPPILPHKAALVVQPVGALVDALNRYLLEQHAGGHRVVVVIDEAQNLSPDALEQVRLLTNLETPKEKLLQMVLLGQPELRQLLQRQDLRQLAQRITARYHLAPLNDTETAAYARHRMKVAGAQSSPFTRSALRAVYRRSGGVPRLINIIADRALAGAYGRETLRVNARLVHAAADEVQPGEARIRPNPWRGVAVTAAALLLLVVSVLLWRGGYLDPRAAAPAAVAAAGFAVDDDEPLEGFDRVYVTDPFGNRIELMQPTA